MDVDSPRKNPSMAAEVVARLTKAKWRWPSAPQWAKHRQFHSY